MKKLYYVAHPYTPKGNKTIELNLEHCAKCCNRLLDLGYIIFSPITHSHQLELRDKRDYNFWINFDLEILKHCDGLILCGNWEDSEGCLIERQQADIMGLEILLYKKIILKREKYVD